MFPKISIEFGKKILLEFCLLGTKPEKMGDGTNPERENRLILYTDAHSFRYPQGTTASMLYRQVGKVKIKPHRLSIWSIFT